MVAPRTAALGIGGSLFSPWRSSRLVEQTLTFLAAAGARTELLELSSLSADGLLARRPDAAVEAALRKLAEASILVVGTPIYRASYTGQLKAFFDLMPREALAGKVVGLIATGAGPTHLLAVDHGLRPLVASLGGLSAARAVYATDAELGGLPAEPIPEPICEQLRALADELRALCA